MPQGDIKKKIERLKDKSRLHWAESVYFLEESRKLLKCSRKRLAQSDKADEKIKQLKKKRRKKNK